MDGATEIVGVPAGPEFRYAWPHALGSGLHRMELFKRSEAAAGHVVFRGVEVADPSSAQAPKSRPYQLKIQFIGDSIMVGACTNEDGDNDQWEDRRTHNHALSYDYLTSQALHADHRAMAVSGMGIATGWVEVKAAQVWDKIYPRPDSPQADLVAWKPDLVFINLGENDDSFTRAHQRPFPDGYTSGYIALVKAVRASWPQAWIILLRGGMYGGAKSPEFRAAWEAAVRQLESSDEAISHYVFTHWSMNHPRVSDDRAMADELVTWLKQQPFLKVADRSAAQTRPSFTRRYMARAMTTIPRSSINATVESGTLSAVPMQAHSTSRPLRSALITPSAPNPSTMIVAR